MLVHNAVANRAHATTTLDAMLKRNVATYPLELTLRPGVRAVLVELGSMLRHSPQWRRGVEMVSRHNCYKHYCYLGTSVALQKSLLQALDLHAHELIAKRLQGTHDHNDHALKKLHAELRQKLVDVRGRGSAYFKEWFFQNPISHLRECDGDRCEFWRFRYPHRRDAALQAIVDQALARFPPRSAAPLVVSSFGAGLLYQEFCHVAKLIHAGYRAIRLVLVDTAYTPWKQKYLARDGCCRIYCQPSSELHPDLLRPAPSYSAPGTTKETLENAAATSVNNAISFVLYNEAIFQFVQWFATEPDVDVQVLVYDSVDAYVADCQIAPQEVRMSGRPLIRHTTAHASRLAHPFSTPPSPPPGARAHLLGDRLQGQRQAARGAREPHGREHAALRRRLRQARHKTGRVAARSVRRGPRPPAAPANTARRCSRVALRRSVRGVRAVASTRHVGSARVPLANEHSPALRRRVCVLGLFACGCRAHILKRIHA